MEEDGVAMSPLTWKGSLHTLLALQGKPGMVAYTCKFSTQEAEGGEPEVPVFIKTLYL